MTDFAHYPSLRGKSVFITGGASGIGESLVEHFSEQGALVKFVDIDTRSAEALVERLGGQGAPRPAFEYCDVRDISALQAAIQALEAERGGIDVLINNAASDDRHAVAAVDVEYWEDRMSVNLRHQFFAAQAVRAGMAKRGGGSIINLGSIVVQMGDADSVAYVTAKGAIHAMTRSLARSFGRDRIRINCLLPGWVMTERQIKLWLDEAGERHIAERQCIPDKLVPGDIARMALFLAADDSIHCTSQNFTVDGGWV
jgi:NAD(P)-dependent dehydrogenase (short-subunit alcohol dehydrogenase family)